MDVITTTLNSTADLDALCEGKIWETFFMTAMFTILGVAGLVLVAVVFHIALDNVRRAGQNSLSSGAYFERYESESDYTKRICETAGWNELLSTEGCRVAMFTHLTLITERKANSSTQWPEYCEALCQLSYCRSLKSLREWMLTFRDNNNVLDCVRPLVGMAYWCAANEKPEHQRFCKKEKSFKTSEQKVA